jgi:predicted  nucleic acid-binding Zn-ribbon protein
MNLKEEIRKLIDLQKIDSQSFGLKKKKDGDLPEQIAVLKSDFESKKTILATLEQEHTSIQVRKKEKELDLATKEEGISKCNGQLYQLKTNQEYKAKLKEIESLKADSSVIEEDILRIMEEVDENKKKLSEKKSVIDQQEAEANKKIKELEEQIKELDIRVKGLEDKRKIITTTIDKPLLSRYEHLLNNRQGVALVPLEDFRCGGCFMNLPAEILNKVKQYHEIIDCEFCARMLYSAEDFNA